MTASSSGPPSVVAAAALREPDAAWEPADALGRYTLGAATRRIVDWLAGGPGA